MLVIVHNGNVTFLLKTLLNIETVGRFYIFQVYAAESGRNGFYRVNEFVNVSEVDFNVEGVDACENLE